MNAINITSSFSKREKMRLKPQPQRGVCQSRPAIGHDSPQHVVDGLGPHVRRALFPQPRQNVAIEQTLNPPRVLVARPDHVGEKGLAQLGKAFLAFLSSALRWRLSCATSLRLSTSARAFVARFRPSCKDTSG
jgi:hypothetical protein